MTSLPRFGQTAPDMTDAADMEVVSDALVAIDAAAMMYGQGLFASRPAAGVAGRVYWATDVGPNGKAYYDTGAAWKEAAPSVDVQTFTSNGTWTKPAGAVLVEYMVVGGGGGGSGTSGGASYVNGSDGVASEFGTIIAVPGIGAAGANGADGNPQVEFGGGGNGGTYGPGGSSSIGIPSPINGVGSFAGGSGGASYGPGSAGAASGGNSATAAAANTGGGGGGAGNTSVDGCGGGSGGQIIAGSLPASKFSATEAVVIGSGGAGGNSTYDGGAGGSGIVIVTTYF